MFGVFFTLVKAWNWIVLSESVIVTFQYKLSALEGYKVFDKDVWTLQYSNKSVADDSPAIVPVEKDLKKTIINRSVPWIILLR